MTSVKFSEDAVNLLSAAKIPSYSNVLELDPVKLAEDNSFLLTDRDGVLGPYGHPTNSQSLEWLAEAGAALDKGVAIFTSNPSIKESALPKGVSFASADFMRPHHFKPSPFGVKRALRGRGASPDETLAIGDGCTDLLAYRLAGIKKLGMVASLGAHPLQDKVHRYLYSPVVVPFAAKLLRLVRDNVGNDDTDRRDDASNYDKDHITNTMV